MESPVNRFQKHQFVLVDLRRVQAGNLTPSASRIVAILEILGCEDERCKKHAPPTLHSPTNGLAPGLVLSHVMARHVGLDLDEVV